MRVLNRTVWFRFGYRVAKPDQNQTMATLEKLRPPRVERVDELLTPVWIPLMAIALTCCWLWYSQWDEVLTFQVDNRGIHARHNYLATHSCNRFATGPWVAILSHNCGVAGGPQEVLQTRNSQFATLQNRNSAPEIYPNIIQTLLYSK